MGDLADFSHEEISAIYKSEKANRRSKYAISYA